MLAFRRLMPRAEGERQLNRLQRGGRRCENVEQDLESLSRQPADDAVEDIAAEHEKTAHRIAQILFDDQPRQPCPQQADLNAALREVADAAAGDESAADHDLGLATAQTVQHAGQQPLVMLQVGVHHRDIRGGAGQRAFDAGR